MSNKVIKALPSILITDSNWDDLRVSLATARTSGSSSPNFTVFRNGVYVWQFISSNTRELFFNLQFPHEWEEGTDVVPHVHFSNNRAGDGTEQISFGLEYTCANINESFPETTTITTSPVTVSTTQYQHQIASFGTLSMSGKKLSTIMMCRLFRNNGIANNYSDGIFAIDFDIHIQKNTMGSLQEINKF